MSVLSVILGDPELRILRVQEGVGVGVESRSGRIRSLLLADLQRKGMWRGALPDPVGTATKVSVRVPDDTLPEIARRRGAAEQSKYIRGVIRACGTSEDVENDGAGPASSVALPPKERPSAAASPSQRPSAARGGAGGASPTQPVEVQLPAGFDALPFERRVTILLRVGQYSPFGVDGPCIRVHLHPPRPEKEPWFPIDEYIGEAGDCRALTSMLAGEAKTFLLGAQLGDEGRLIATVEPFLRIVDSLIEEALARILSFADVRGLHYDVTLRFVPVKGHMLAQMGVSVRRVLTYD